MVGAGGARRGLIGALSGSLGLGVLGEVAARRYDGEVGLDVEAAETVGLPTSRALQTSVSIQSLAAAKSAGCALVVRLNR